MNGTMMAAYLPDDCTVQLREVVIPVPGSGQVLIRTKASTLCGNDVRAMYQAHLGIRPEESRNVTTGHESAGQIVECGSGMRRFGVGDRVVVYHISGCGLCMDCRRGYMVNCTSPLKAAYGWQRDGGMAPYILADEKDLVPLPDELTYIDGAQLACGFGTVFEGLDKIGVSGQDAVLVVGLGSAGQASLMLARAMGARHLAGVDMAIDRCEAARTKGLADEIFLAGENTLDYLLTVTRGVGFERVVDCSGNTAGRRLAVRTAAKRGRIALIGDGGNMDISPGSDLVHDQKTMYGSWVTSIWKLEELVNDLVRWEVHPEELVTHLFPLDMIVEAYEVMAQGHCGRVTIVFD